MKCANLQCQTLTIPSDTAGKHVPTLAIPSDTASKRVPNGGNAAIFKGILLALSVGLAIWGVILWAIWKLIK
jgi:hypothetical protein